MMLYDEMKKIAKYENQIDKKKFPTRLFRFLPNAEEISPFLFENKYFILILAVRAVRSLQCLILIAIN
jgi:hypothetical protein